MTAITIIGAGFNALTTVRELRRRKGDAAITVIASADSFAYLPSLIWLPAGLRHGRDLVVLLHDFFARHNVTHHRAAVKHVSADGRTVFTNAGTVANDALVIASGRRFPCKLPGIEHADPVEAVRCLMVDGPVFAMTISTPATHRLSRNREFDHDRSIAR